MVGEDARKGLWPSEALTQSNARTLLSSQLGFRVQSESATE